MTFQVEVQETQVHFSKTELMDHLYTLSTESKKMPNWQIPSITPDVQQSILNQLRMQILESDDKKLIALFHRAVRHHDSLHKAHQADPVTVYNRHYRESDFLVPDIHVTLDVKEKFVRVISFLHVKRQSDASHLILDGRGHDVMEVYVDDEKLDPAQYRVTAHELILSTVPRHGEFTVEVVSKIDPFHNDSMEGLYQSGTWLTTQCESEGARRIFYTVDRPDNLSRYLTTIIADKEKYPYRISNGNLVSEKIEDDGRAIITWDDPFPKPSYLFAAVLGDFSVLEDSYKTKSGRDVKLQVYVEKGKESRADYSLYVLKKAMEFDETFFDREYDLDELKMVAIPHFNMGAMENKGLLIFNETALLVDQNSGSDMNYQVVAKIVMHEYAHNWSGNRVTVRNWFEVALKEAFTDFRAMLFEDWLFGEDYTRPQQVEVLREFQFPEDAGPSAHPIQVDSYVTAGGLYDGTTYIKGREVFRMLNTILQGNPKGDFRKAQNEYFSKYDGKAVTFRELLSTVNEVCKVDLTAYERWFHQAGTPKVMADMEYNPDDKEVRLQVQQSCPSPKDGREQKPFHIPLVLEFLSEDGTVILPRTKFDFKAQETIYTFEEIEEKPIPVFLHGFSAPVRLEYDYTDQELRTIMIHEADTFCRTEAAKTYLQRHLQKMAKDIREGKSEVKADPDLLQTFTDVLQSEKLTPYAKAQLMKLPSVRSLVEKDEVYDFHAAAQARRVLRKSIGENLEGVLLDLLDRHPDPENYDPTSDRFVDEVKLRELRNQCWTYLVKGSPDRYLPHILKEYDSAKNLNNKMAMLQLIVDSDSPQKQKILQSLHDEWKADSALFNKWIVYQTSSVNCDVKTLEDLQQSEGFEEKNPNHLRSVYRTFVRNLSQYHDPDGKGYAYVTDAILRIADFNPLVAMNYIAKGAYQDYQKLPPKQKEMMAEQLRRITDAPGIDSRLREYAASTLKSPN